MSWDDNLDDFERQLAADKERRKQEDATLRTRHKEHKHKHENRDHRQERHHHRRRRDRDRKDEDRDSEDRHRHKRRRHSDTRDNEGNEQEHGYGKYKEEEHEVGTAEGTTSPQKASSTVRSNASLTRDAWMEAPTALDIDYTSKPTAISHLISGSQSSPKTEFGQRLHETELKLHHIRDSDSDEEGVTIKESDQHGVDYEFGDGGSRWRLMKLKNAYREAEETGKEVEEVALKRYGSLKAFDNAREEETEMDRRQRYGEGYVGKSKPSGDLFAERQLETSKVNSGPNHAGAATTDVEEKAFVSANRAGGDIQSTTGPGIVDPTMLNRLRAQLMKARLKGLPHVKQLEEEYQRAQAASESQQNSGTITMGVMENRMLAGGRQEVKAVTTKRGIDRGQVVSNEDMTIDDMLREERRTRGTHGNEDKRFASRIAKDGKFVNDLEYMDENATKLAQRTHQSDATLRSKAIAEHKQTADIILSCPLCHQEDRQHDPLPVAPIVSMAHRSYLTLPTMPEITVQTGAVIVPFTHHENLLHCDDDEWEEIRNFMKSLTRLYFSRGMGILFYENAAHPRQRRHAALNCVPISHSLVDDSPAFFREAILASDDEWAQHRKIIDTRGKGRNGFRRSIAKEAPYFHVWTELDGGLGHVIEDERKWPRGDLFARETLGGMLRVKTEIWRKQGRWERNSSYTKDRIVKFRKAWDKYDWTTALLEE